jgi:predicted dehydrogenase
MIEAPVLPRQRSVSTLPPAFARPRLGFAGVGWIGRNRLEAIARSGLAAIEAIVDADITVAEAAAESLPGAVLSSSFDSLLDRDLDGIVVATPSALHAEQAIACLESGKAVFCQKPLGRNGAETAAVVETAARVDRLLGVDLSYRHTQAAEAVRELISSGELGDIYAVEAVFHNAYGPDKSWFYDRNLSGGGCLLDLGIHVMDLCLWCLGFPPVVSAHGHLRSRLEPGFDLTKGVEDYAAGQVELGSGAVMRLACSWGAPAGRDAVIEWVFFGTRGGAAIRNVGGSFHDFVAERYWPDRTRKVLASPPDEWGGRAAVRWVERLARSPAFNPEIRDLKAVAATLDLLYGNRPC